MTKKTLPIIRTGKKMCTVFWKIFLVLTRTRRRRIVFIGLFLSTLLAFLKVKFWENLIY